MGRRPAGLARLVARRATTSATASSWARTTCRSTRVSFPATLLGSGEPWKLVDTVKGFNWLNYYGGKFSTSQQARRLHGPGARHAARRLLALVAHRQRARERRHRLHLGALRRRREQGPRRHLRQLRQPLPVLRRSRFDFDGAGSAGRARSASNGKLATRTSMPISPACAPTTKRSAFRKAAAGNARDLEAGKRLSQRGGALAAIAQPTASAPPRSSIPASNLVRIAALVAWPFIPFAAERSARLPRASRSPGRQGLASLPAGRRVSSCRRCCSA